MRIKRHYQDCSSSKRLCSD